MVKFFILNPGSEVVHSARKDLADHNIARLVEDVGLPEISVRSNSQSFRGRFGYATRS